MELVDMKKLETAITYLKRMAEGSNPINNLPAEDDSVINNPNVIRCMFFVKDILEEVKRNDGYIGKRVRKSKKQDFPIENVDSFVYAEDKTITKLVEQINDGIDTTTYSKLKYNQVTQWLKLNGFLKEEKSQEFNKTITLPTQKGLDVGIRAERRIGSRGEYMVVIYGKQAQEFIVQNIKMIISGEVSD